MAPSRVLTRMAAAVSAPKPESVLILKPTLTSPSSSSIELTLPTRTPAMRTSSLTLRPPASQNEA